MTNPSISNACLFGLGMGSRPLALQLLTLMGPPAAKHAAGARKGYLW